MGGEPWAAGRPRGRAGGLLWRPPRGGAVQVQEEGEWRTNGAGGVDALRPWRRYRQVEGGRCSNTSRLLARVRLAP